MATGLRRQQQYLPNLAQKPWSNAEIDKIDTSEIVRDQIG